MSQFYISRKLHSDRGVVSDLDLLNTSGVIVVLAEPGAGKSDLLSFFSRYYSVPREVAQIFCHKQAYPANVLIVDSLDEVARIDEAIINQIIIKANDTKASKVIFASRSYIWDDARTKVIRDVFGSDPLVLRLQAFDQEEQKKLFEYHLENENFEAFLRETDRFDLTPILGNPQFLKLFADAYIQGGRVFTSKLKIYSDAILRLASENPEAGGQRERPTNRQIIETSGEVFAKLLLSGSVGVSTQEILNDESYPYVHGVSKDFKVLNFVLNTKMFKPTDAVNKHEPVHRIIAEYSAANYLVSRIQDKIKPLSIKRCLAVIAPNGAVRSELRGLLGWMASLGNSSLQESIINLDPYAVFANGDPSQLTTAVKVRLLSSLYELSQEDPYFRRMDSWRRFSVGSFFSKDITYKVRELLKKQLSNSHLRSLLLDLLHNTEASKELISEFQSILHDENSELDERQRSLDNLIAISYESLSDLDLLVKLGSANSLKLASEIAVNYGTEKIGIDRIFSLLEGLANLYPANDLKDRNFDTRYYIKRIFPILSSFDTVNLLNKISPLLICVCGKQQDYQCTCRLGRSKIAALLLDRYFEITVGPYDWRQINFWTQKLNFRGHHRVESISVKQLSSEHGLRQAIYIDALKSKKSHQEIIDARVKFQMGTGHYGLSMQSADLKAIVDYAYKNNDYLLWEHFAPGHSPFDTQKRSDPLRTHMREQARAQASFLKTWCLRERRNKIQFNADRDMYPRTRSKYEKRQEKIKRTNKKHFAENRDLILQGKSGWWLTYFAQHYLHDTDEILQYVDDHGVPEMTLLNSIGRFLEMLPTTDALIDRSASNVCMIFEAACLALFRKEGTLKRIDRRILEAIKIGGIGGSKYQDDEKQKFEAELDRFLFKNKQDKIEFVKKFIEPHLLGSDGSATNIYIVAQSPTFADIKGELALTWLSLCPNMPIESLNTLFSVAAVSSDRSKLLELISRRSQEPRGTSTKEINKNDFWRLRNFFFISPVDNENWIKFSANQDAIFSIERHSGRITRRDSENWPQISAEKIFLILDTYITSWPKVFLPSMFGTGDPNEEVAFRFLSDLIYQIGRDEPSLSIPVFEKLLAGNKFADFYDDLKSQRALALRQSALSDYEPPSTFDISNLIDSNMISAVEDMRAFMIESLEQLQVELNGAATNSKDIFYNGDVRLDENSSRNRIVDLLKKEFNSLNMGVIIEHQMQNGNRCDFTASVVVAGKEKVLVVEVKGQWNDELYHAAASQLIDRYSIYPGAADQGIYLILWFGSDEKVAGKKNIFIQSAAELKNSIVESMPVSLRGKVDVFVLDLSRQLKVKTSKQPPSAAKNKARRRSVKGE